MNKRNKGENGIAIWSLLDCNEHEHHIKREWTTHKNDGIENQEHQKNNTNNYLH